MLSSMRALIPFFILWMAGCSVLDSYVPDATPIDNSNLPPSDLIVSIPNLSTCTDAKEDVLHLSSKSPVTVLVHGCRGSAGRFRSLAQLYAFHGQQTVCFNYDDRDRLIQSADELSKSIAQLVNLIEHQKILIFGHSMGGLIARKALESGHGVLAPVDDTALELITVSAPFAGMDAADHCGIRSLRWLSLGLVPGICWLITGDNWNEITSRSDFILYPRELNSSVRRYLKVVTNEKNTCRREDEGGQCIKSDFVFKLAEQYHPIIDGYPNVTGVEVDAGHVEIIGDRQIAPRKLISILQSYGMLSHTPTNREQDFEKLLVALY